MQTKNITVEGLFRGDDAMGKGSVPVQAWCIVLGRVFEVRELDAKVLALRY